VDKAVNVDREVEAAVEEKADMKRKQSELSMFRKESTDVVEALVDKGVFVKYCLFRPIHPNVTQLLLRRLPAYIIIVGSSFNYIDVSGLAVLGEIYDEMQEIGVEVKWIKYCNWPTTIIQVLYAAFKGPVRAALDIGGFHDRVPKSKLFPSVHDAVVYAQSNVQHKAHEQHLNDLLRKNSCASNSDEKHVPDDHENKK
jgi:hypothetical protein